MDKNTEVLDTQTNTVLSFPKDSIGKEIRIDFSPLHQDIDALTSEHILSQQCSLLSALLSVNIGRADFSPVTGELTLLFSEPTDKEKELANLVGEIVMDADSLQSLKDRGIDVDIPTAILSFIDHSNLYMRVRIVPEDLTLDISQYVYSDLHIQGVKSDVSPDEYGRLLKTSIVGTNTEEYSNITTINTAGTLATHTNDSLDNDYSNISSILVLSHKSNDSDSKLESTATQFVEWLRSIESNSSTQQIEVTDGNNKGVLEGIHGILGTNAIHDAPRVRHSAPKRNSQAQAKSIAKRRAAKKKAKKSKQRNR